MKNKILILAGLALLAAPLTWTEKAHAYSSQAGADPDYSDSVTGEAPGPLSHEVETKGIKKTTDSGESEALIAGLIVGYDPGRSDGYTVTRAVAQTEVGQKTLACVTTDVVATGDTGYHRCITKGFARVRYSGSGTQAMVAGRGICVTASGLARGCDFGSTVEATANTGIISLETKSGTGTNLKVLINLR